MQQQLRNSHQRSDLVEDEVPKDLTNRKISQLSDIPLRYTYSNASSASQFCIQPTTSDQFESKCIKDDQLYNDLLEKIVNVKNILSIDHEDICLYILQFYQWNEQKMTNNYFTDDWTNISQHSTQYQQNCNSLIAKQGDCQVCLEHNLIYSTGFCNHYYCKSCWNGYIKQQLLSGRIFSNCMNTPSCQKSPMLKTFVDKIAPELTELNRKKICINYAIQNKDICYCPNQKCPYFCTKPNMMEINTVTCPCGELYCFKCKKQPHEPVKCQNVKRWYQLINSQQINNAWINFYTRKCPKCDQPIQKKVGCSHMKCLCNCQFCYECNKIWDESHNIKKTECPNRKNLKKKQIKNDRVVQLDQYLTELMKQAQKNRILLTQCQDLIQDETLLSRVRQLKTQVISAWMSFKWTKIMRCLQNKIDIDSELQNEFIEKIKSVMQPIQIIIKNGKNLASKQLHYYGQQVLQRKQVLKKYINTWQQAWLQAIN